jgi:hypothetical protein
MISSGVAVNAKGFASRFQFSMYDLIYYALAPRDKIRSRLERGE